MKMPMKKIFRWVNRPGLMLLTLCFVFLCAFQSLCNAQLEATAKPDGEIELVWSGGNADVYRDTSRLEELDDITAKLLDAGQNVSSPWSDNDTTDGTKYYYAVDIGMDSTIDYYAEAVADKTPPSVENIAAYPSPFSPDSDRIEDTTKIFFTLTETTFVTLRVYHESDPGTPIITLLDNEELDPGDNFVVWDGWDETLLPDPGYAFDGRYIYKFEASTTKDVAGNSLIQSVSGDVVILSIQFELKDISVTPTPFSPDGDRVRDITYISYEIVDPGFSDFSSDYVAGNIFSIMDGRSSIIAKIYVECLDYYWDNFSLSWVSFHVTNGIRPGLSSEKYYLRPINLTDPTEPPFHVSSPYPGDAETISEYMTNYYAANTNWIPVPFTMSWNGSGATGASTYIVRLEAVKYNGAKTLYKTHEIIIESPTIVPNDKTAPIVVSTFPAENSVYSAPLSYVKAYLNDGQGTGPDLTHSSISLIGPAGETIPGRQINNGEDTITWRLQEDLAEDGTDDGIYTIVVSAIDYAKNRGEDLRFGFEYNTRLNDDGPPFVDDSPIAVSEDGENEYTINDDGTTVIDLSPSPTQDDAINRFIVNVCDHVSGISLNNSDIELVKIVGSQEILVSGEKNAIPDDNGCGILVLQLNRSLYIDGHDDGIYKLRVTILDLAENSSVEEFIFMYKTVDDLDGPSVQYVWLTDEDGDSVVESTSPYHLGQVSGTIVSICARVFDPSVSTGISFDIGKSYIELTGPDGGAVSGEITYTGRSSTVDGAFANIVFTFDNPLSDDTMYDGDYVAAIVAEDNSGNSTGDVVATFEYVSSTSIIVDTEPPLIDDVSVLSQAVQNAGPLCLDKNPYVGDAEGVQVILVDEGSGVNSELSYIKVIEPTVRLLFTIASGVETDQNELDNGNVPSSVRDGFAANSIPFSDDDDRIVVLTEEENRRWQINDTVENRAYTVMKEFGETDDELTGPELKIYDRYEVNGELTAESESGSLTLEWPVSLSLRGWCTLDVFAVDNVRRSLFSVDLEDFQIEHGTDLVAELDFSIISEELRNGTYGFGDNGITLSENVIVSVKDRGCLWLITDLGQAEFDVYSSGGCRWRRIDDQKLYIVERKVWKEGNEVKGRLDISESNAMTVQIPDVLFFDDTAPVIDPIVALFNGAPVTTQFNSIRATIAENDSGINYKVTGVVLKDENGKVIPGSLQLDKENGIITWLLETAQSLESTSYVVEVKTADMAGNESSVVVSLDSVLAEDEPLAPEVVSVSPEDGAIIGDTISQVSAVLKDNSGSGIDFERSTIEVNAPSGVPSWWKVQGYQSADEEKQTIIWNFRQFLATDGRCDGEYDIVARAYDNDGRRSDLFRSSFTYDTQPPEVLTVEFGTRPWIAANYQSIAELKGGGTNRTLTTLIVKLTDKYSDIDLIGSSVEIVGLQTYQTHNGIDTIVVDFPVLSKDGEDDGIYQINVKAVDSLGNTNPFPYAPPYTYTFIYDTQPPQMVESEPAEGSTVLKMLDRVKVKLDDGEFGVGPSPSLSADTIFVYGPHGKMQGTRETEGADTSIFVFDAPLSTTDSTDDGTYLVNFTAIDKVGNRVPVEFSFEYKALEPRLVDIEIITDADEVFSLSSEENKTLERSVVKVRAILEDRSGKGINFNSSIVVVGGPGVSEQDTSENDGVNSITYIFAEPLANDGTDDGEYPVFVRAVDNDGHWGEYLVSFRYDSTAPEVVSTSPADGSVISEPISGVSATLYDATTKFDLFESKIGLSGPASIVATQVNNGVDTIALKFRELADNGTEDGRYTISVEPRDILGNALPEPLTFSFIYDTKAPEIVSTEPANGEVFTLAIDRVMAVLDDGAVGEAAGIDLDACSISLKGPGGGSLAGEVHREEPDTLIFVPSTPLAVDGTDDGTYTVTIVTQDMIGNTSAPILINFTYTTMAPAVLSTTPADGAQFRMPINNATAKLMDNSGAGLDLQNSMVTILDPDGVPVPGKHSSIAPDTIVFTPDYLLATDGTDDGLYTLDIIAADKTGISVNYKTTFRYDRTPPVVSFTVPADGDIVKENMGFVSARLEDSGSGVNLDASTIVLKGPMGSVPGTQVNDGVNTIIWDIAYLPDDSTADGYYTIEVLPVDRVGNAATIARTFKFIYDTAAPIVVRTEPAEGDTVIVELSRVSAVLKDVDGVGIDLEASEIHLYAPDDQEILGVETTDGVNTLILTFLPLAVDGSADGLYTIAIKTQDLAGNVGITRVTFDYKALAPVLVDVEVASDDDTVLSLAKDENKQFERSIIEVRAILEDRSGSGINFAACLVIVDGPGASGWDTISNNGVDTLIYTFAEPFANDGSDDGEYFVGVRAVDNDGHWAEYYALFYFDSTAPRIVATIPDMKQTLPVVDDDPVPAYNTPISEVSVQIYDEMSGVDLFESEVSLQAPISMTTEKVNNGVDTVTLRFFKLPANGTADGLYRMSVNPHDILGSDFPEAYTFDFIYDTRHPVINSTNPASGEVVTTPIEFVTAVLTDGKAGETAGVDLNACSLELIGPDGEKIAGEVDREVPNALKFVLNTPLINSGEGDGTYTISVVTQDVLGNASDPILVNFTRVTRAPVVFVTIPSDGANLLVPISYVAANLKDNSGDGLDMEKSKVTLLGPDGEAVPGTSKSIEPDIVTYELDYLLATDGSDDGVYTLDILAVDKTNVSASYRTSFVYDTTPPVVIGTVPADGHIMRESIDYVSARLEDAGSGVNLASSVIGLSGPVSLSATQVNDGVDTIKLTFAPLSSKANTDGLYTISVTPSDKIGNVPAEPRKFTFIYDTTPPVVKETQPAAGSTFVAALDRVSVKLDDGTGAGPDLGKSVIKLYGPNGSQIAGARADEADAMVLTFSELAIDGKDNGKYTIAVVAQDKIGNIGAERRIDFMYVPTAPNLVSVSPEDGSFISTSVKRIAAGLEDKSGSGIDFDNSWIKLLNPGGQEIGGQLSNDGVNNLFLDLQIPLAKNGTDDGEYTVQVRAIDKKKNAATYTLKFLYDTSPCVISSVSIGNGGNSISLSATANTIVPSNFGLVSRVDIVMQDAEAGVDIEQTKVTLKYPGGSNVIVSLLDNGVDTISLELLGGIDTNGVYTVTVDPVDKLGNKGVQEKAYSFLVDTSVPVVAASEPADISTVVNRKLSEVSVQLDDGEGSGIAEESLMLKVSGPNGEVAGNLEVKWSGSGNRFCSLVYRFGASLPMDGSADGDYLISLWLLDKAGNGSPKGSDDPVKLRFTYDTIQPGGPVISNVGVFPKAFSPNGDGIYDSTQISYVLSKNANVKLSIYDSSMELVQVLLDSVPRTAGTNNVVWNGSVGGNLLPDGTYMIKIDAVDSMGLTGAVESSSVVIDTVPPSVENPLVSNNPFTPDGDGSSDRTKISFVVSSSQPEDSVSVAIYDQSLDVVTSLYLNGSFIGDGEYYAFWYGDGAEQDGEYIFVITARDDAGNVREVSGTVSLDKAGPILKVLNPGSRELLTNQSPIVLSGTAADWSGIRSVSLSGIFVPHGSTSPVDDPLNNWVKMTFSGDKIDNDADGKVDEEKFDGIDNDGDGRVDEDLVGVNGISDPVNWIYRIVPQTDGEYSIKFRSLDSLGHASVSQDSLRILYDTAPPLHVSTSGISSASGDSEDAIVRNGNTVTVTTKWDQSGYGIMMDFSQLDSMFSGTVKAEDRGNGTYIAHYMVSKENTYPDGLKTIVMTAKDAVGNMTVMNKFGMKLRNNLPTIVSVSSDRTAFANGSAVEILVECDANDLTVSADFSDLDSTYTPDKVKVTNNGNNTYLLRYTIGMNNMMIDRPNVTILVSASDGLESVLSEYVVALDNTEPVVQKVIVNAEVASTGSYVSDQVFANGDTIEIVTEWDGSGYDVSADFSGMDSTYKPGAENVESPGQESVPFAYTISYKLGSANKISDGRDKPVIVRAVDRAGNVAEFLLLIGLDNTPPDILSVTGMDNDTVYKNGDTVKIIVKLDAPGYVVSGDFSKLDSKYQSRLDREKGKVIDNGDGTYSLEYTISNENTMAASGTVSGIKIAVSASDSVGNISTDSSMTVSLDNLSPELTIESPASDVLVARAWIEIKGQTEPDAKLLVKPKTTSATVEGNGKFTCLVPLTLGDNVITITVEDVAGNQASETLTVVYRPLISAVDGGTVYLPEKKDDGIAGNDTKVVIPAGAMDQDFAVEIKELEPGSVPPAVDNPYIGRGSISPLAVYEFTLVDSSGQRQLSVAFTKPIEMYLQYQDLGKLDGAAVVFRWDGIRWNKIGGEENRANNTVKIMVNSFSVFGIFREEVAPKEFKLAGAFPNPFTPNSDTVNDVVSFYFDNPGNSAAVIRIFDLRGALIRRLESGLSSWDGLDDNGEPAEMGVYVYQIEVNNEFEGGTIVLAR